ncbi:interferon-induced, double-stranded RNA-activated protein kinase-like isoform 2-T2 [Pholidichthys leucotaenia]
MENYIAKLNEYAQKHRCTLHYEDVASVGPDHMKTFTLRAVVNGKTYPDGEGKNKKEAKQNAAKNAYDALTQEQAESIENSAAKSPTVSLSQSSNNYMCWLNEYSQRNNVLARAVEAVMSGPNNTTQRCNFVVGDKEYPAAFGKTRREATEEAAKLVYNEIIGSTTTQTRDEKCSSTSNQEKNTLDQNVSETFGQTKKTGDKCFTETNFIGILNEYCQRTKRLHTFIEEKICGPAHNRQFFYKVVIDSKEYQVGEGKTVKEAKQKAAQHAMSALHEQSDWDSKGTLKSADDGTPSKRFTPPTTLDSGLLISSSPTTTSGSVVSSNSSNPPKEQEQNPAVKPKVKLAANFQNAHGSSKEDVNPNFHIKSKEGIPTKSTKTTPVTSRFTLEFDCIDSLGKGAFGRVFKAKQKLLGKYYAIKIVRCREKALREVSALSDLNHANIVRYFTCWLEDSEYMVESTADSFSSSQSSSDSALKYLYIQMELCDTKTLRVWIDEKNTQNVKKSLRDSKRREDSLNIALQLLDGVEYIHSKSLIHRDLKPANILFGRDGGVKIGDFGLVTAEDDDDAENRKERSTYKGTPSYMAPEQKSRNTYDRKVDIFALGLIYFELLWNLTAGHEKNMIWGDVRDQTFPQGFSHHFHQEVLVHS